MNTSCVRNSSAENGTPAPGVCGCCGTWALLKPHWDRPEIMLCVPCRTLIFTFEANSDIAHSAYALWTEELGGDL